MAIRTEIFKISDYDRKHWMYCPVEGVEKYEPSGIGIDGTPNSSGADGYGTGNLTCRACNVAKIAVTVEGVEYANYPKGTIDSRKSLYLNSAGEQYTQVFSTHHVGLVITTRERNYHDDSDFYALVWNPETKRVNERGYATTRGGGTDSNSATADLADEYKADYRQYLIDEQVEALRAADHAEWVRAAYVATNPGTKGQTVKVTKGRKVPVGFTGTIIWTGTDSYGKDRIGIKSADGDVQFTAASNVEVLIDSDDLPYEADSTKTDEEYIKTATGLVDWQGARGYIARNAPSGINVVA